MFEAQEKTHRSKKEQAEARLADLIGLAGDVEWSDLPAAEKARKLTVIQRDRAQARVDLLDATEALASADTRRKLAYRASAEQAIARIGPERAQVWTAAKAEVARLRTALDTLNAAAAELTRLSTLDTELYRAAANEANRGGLPADFPTTLGAGIGVLPTATLEWSIGASEAALVQARTGRFPGKGN